MTKLSMSEEEMLKRKYTKPYEKRNEELEKENEELKKQLGMSDKVYNDNLDYSYHIEDQLTKAKEILKMIVDYYPCYNKTITEQAEQFLKEMENDN